MKTRILHGVLVISLMTSVNLAWAQGTAFTYHGQLNDNGSPAHGSYDLIFSVFEADTGTNQLGATITNTALQVSGGLFTATLDFGSGIFTGPDRWLEIGVRTNGAGEFTPLSARQRLTPTPYAIMANTSSNLLGTVPAGQLSGTLTDGQLPANVALLNADQAFTGAQTFLNPTNSFSGSGTGLTGLSPANLVAGTAAIDISGHAATATSAALAATAAAAANFIGPLAGDVTGYQGATVVANVAGQSAASVANGASAANAATNANTADTIVRRDSTGSFAAGGIAATNFTGPGSGLTELNASALTSGAVADERLSGNVALLNAHQTFLGSNLFSGVAQLTNTDNTLVGSFAGVGSSLTGLNPTNLAPGTASINISGHAATSTRATTADSATTAATAGSAAAFTGPLAGDVTGSQAATVVGTVGGQSAAQVASGVVAANAATAAATPDTIVKRDSAGGFVAGDITAGRFSGAGAGLTALNASELASGTVADERLSANVPLLDAHQTFSGSNTFAGVNTFTNATNTFVGTFAGDGAGLSNLVVVAGNVFGSIPAAQLSGILPSSLLAGTYSNALTFNNPANSFTGDGAGLTGVNAEALEGLGAASFWQLGGNGATTPGVDFLGTTDTNALELKVNSERGFRLEPTTNGPNLIGGWTSNAVDAGVGGATVGGGGTPYADIRHRYSFLAPLTFTNRPNRVVGHLSGPFGSSGYASDYATVGGGIGNTIGPSSALSTICGGVNNLIGGSDYIDCVGSTIGGGSGNYIPGDGYIGQGFYNTIGGGSKNRVSGTGECTISGGGGNSIGPEIQGTTIGGGKGNVASGDISTIAGGGGNVIDWVGPNFGHTISGGRGNYISSFYYSTIGGGQSNRVIEAGGNGSGYSFIGGGQGNGANGSSVVGGGQGNGAGSYSFVGGGQANNASSFSAVGGGRSNRVTGSYSVIPGGFENTATGGYALAAGSRAKANHQGAFVWAAGNTNDYPSQADNRFHVYSEGGVEIEYGGQDADGRGLKWMILASQTPGRVINVYNGAYLSEGGNWVDMSDRKAKENFEPVKPREILEKVAALPLTKWNYRQEDASVQHLGPVAQDFHAAFGLGADDRHIAALDSSGVALAAIQGLNEKVESGKQKAESRIDRLEAENAELGKQVAELKAQVETLMEKVNGGAP